MSVAAHSRVLADYNRWMNAKIHAASARLDPEELHADRGAFFGSVFGTLAHILAADTIWLTRFRSHPAGFRALDALRALDDSGSTDGIPPKDLALLAIDRQIVDDVFVALCDEATDEQHACRLRYANRAGQVFDDAFGTLLLHVFNHQTHHRGQATTLLTQAGVDVGVTDRVARQRERASAGSFTADA